MKTQERSIHDNCPISISSVRDFHAKASALLAKDVDLKTTQEELSSLKLPELLKKNGLHFFCWKTFQDCYRMTEAGRLLPSSPRLLSWGMISNGVCITAPISESHSNESGCTLSDILIEDVPEKYFLSPVAMQKLSASLFRDHKDSESTPQEE